MGVNTVSSLQKGGTIDCKNYRRIFLLKTSYKVLSGL